MAEIPDGYVLRRANPFNHRWFWFGYVAGVVAAVIFFIMFSMWWMSFSTW